MPPSSRLMQHVSRQVFSLPPAGVQLVPRCWSFLSQSGALQVGRTLNKFPVVRMADRVRPSSASTDRVVKDDKWHPPTLRPRTAAARTAAAIGGVTSHLARAADMPRASPDSSALEVVDSIRRLLPSHSRVSLTAGLPPRATSPPNATHASTFSAVDRYRANSDLSELNAAASRELERVYRLRRPGSALSRPSSASGYSTRPHSAGPAVSARDNIDQTRSASNTTDSPLRTSAHHPRIGNSRPASAASAIVRCGLLGEMWSDERVLSLLDEQLRTDVTAASLRDLVADELEATTDYRPSVNRFDAFRGQVERAAAGHPTLSRLLTAVFSEVDVVIAHYQRERNTSETQVATDAMRRAVADAAAVHQVSLSRQQRVDDLERVVEQLSAANVAAAEEMAKMSAFVDDIRVALSAVGGSRLAIDDLAERSPRSPASAILPFSGSIRQAASTLAAASPTVAPNPATSAPLQGHPGGVQLRSWPIPPDESSSGSFVECIFRLGLELDALRDENLRLSEIAAGAIDQHTQQSRDMAELLDRANGFQTHVGHMKATMRVMKDYIASLEERVFTLSRVVDTAALDAIDRRSANAFTSGHEVTTAAAESLMWRSLAFRGTVEHDRNHTGPLVQSIKLEVPADLRSVVQDAVIRCGGANGLPLHLANFDFPKLAPRPFDTVEAVNAYITDLNQGFLAVLASRAPGTEFTFDQYLAETFLRKAPGAQPKAAAEAAFTLHHIASRLEHRSPNLCYFYMLQSANKLPGDFLFFAPRHMNALLDRLRVLEPVTKRAKDRVLRSNFLAAVHDCWPNAASTDLHAVAMATVTCGSIDSTKLSDEVCYEAFFQKATAGATFVYDTLLHVLAACGVRFLVAVKRELLRMLREDAVDAHERIRRERLDARSAEVRRMMKLSDAEIVHDPTVCSLAEVRFALQTVDPAIRTNDLKRALAAAAKDPYFVESDLSSPEYGDRCEAVRLSVDDLEARWRQQCFMMPTTRYSAPEYPPPITAVSDIAIAAA
jgi:hypothetical protein